MDETPFRAGDVITQNRWFQLVDTGQGYGIWPAGSDRSEPATEAFSYEDFPDAEERFRKRTREMIGLNVAPRWLAWIVFIAAPVWMLVTGILSAWTIWWSADAARVFIWLSFAQQWLYAVWLSALACMIATFLYRRAQERRHA